MKAYKSTNQRLAEARELEQASRLTEAAELYQQLVDADPTNQQAVARLLTVYRRLKAPKKELAVIESALAAYAQKNKTSQEKWLSAHPQAAKASRAFLRSLGGSSASSFGADAQVQKLLKRKEVVEKKLHGKGKSKGATKGKGKGKAAESAIPKAAESAARKAAESAARKAAESAARKAAAIAAKEKRAEERRLAAEQKKQAAAARKAAATAAKQAAIPSLFIITTRYLVSQDKIEAALPKRAMFLDKHFKAGDFLLAGYQVPRTGDIIIARGKSRSSAERIMTQDPFIKNKLATVDIVEFSAGKINKKQWQQLTKNE